MKHCASRVDGFGDRLAAAVQNKRNGVVVGLDPRREQLPASLRTTEQASLAKTAESFERFCREIVDVVAELVPAVKPQAAFFEQLGPAGMLALGRVVRYATEKDLLVILDGKRNDIGSTAAAYADAYLGRASAWGADCLTVSPYLGEDSLTPFVEVSQQRGAGIFVLVKTSNPGSGFLQDKTIDGQTVYRRMADCVQSLSAGAIGASGYGPIGAVVGATYPAQLVELRAAMPQCWFLVPGFGAQGGTARDVAGAFDESGLGAVVNSSRGIIFAHARDEYRERFGDSRWQEAVAAATRDMIDQLRADTPAGRLGD